MPTSRRADSKDTTIVAVPINATSSRPARKIGNWLGSASSRTSPVTDWVIGMLAAAWSTAVKGTSRHASNVG